MSEAICVTIRIWTCEHVMQIDIMRERDFKEWDDFLFAPQASFFASKLKKTITKKQSSIANKCVLFAFPKIRVYKSGADE